jgi:hypothetical protein
MEADPMLVQNDLSSSAARMAIFWGPGVLLLVLTARLGWWEHTIGWTAGLSWLAIMCLWNGARCQRVHCMFTGPFFLAMAVVTLLVGFRVFSLGNSTWGLLGDTILVGGTVLCFGPELIWGHYWRGAQKEP